MMSYAAASTVSIGTASARGEMRVDNYLVKGNATLFNGSIVETNQATVDLRLNKGTEIRIGTSSRGTLFSDHLVLQRGESELNGSSGFQIEANGLHVSPSEPNSRGVVSMKSGSTIEVSALTGSFGIKNAQGVLVASVRPGQSMAFSMQAAGSAFTGTGVVSEDGGKFYVTIAGVKYQVKGKDLKKLVGKTVTINGTIDADGGVTVTSFTAIGLGFTTGQIVLISSLVIASGVGAAGTVTALNSPPSGASVQ
jgi:hypothetical protein